MQGGDIIAFIMTLNSLNFVEALASIANDWGLS
jgi:DNA primase